LPGLLRLVCTGHEPKRPQRRGTVQHESTATGPDGGALWETLQDGDLHRWTREDVLPTDGMQEVRGSNPLSSTFPQVKGLL
jgi:hypothetical protein